MNNLYDYFINNVDKDKFSHSFLIGNVNYDEIKEDLYKIFNHFIFNNSINEDLSNNADIYIIKPENGIIPKDSIKQLISDINVTSQFNNNKIYVIDSSEKLNEYSYNAILKTLEEPQNNIYAFLLTSNINSIKETIASRCQKIFISSEINEKILDDNIKNISENFINYLESDNISLIAKHPEIYNDIDSRETLNGVLNYLLKYYFNKLNDYVYSNESNNLIDKTSKKILIIDNTINNLKYYLNKNMAIDRFVIEMWRC